MKPIRLLDSQRFLSETDSRAVAERVFPFARGGGETRVQVGSWWQGELRWARNRVSLASDRREVVVTIVRVVAGGPGYATTNQLDDVSLESAVRAAERSADFSRAEPSSQYDAPPPVYEYPKTAIWSDATYGLSTEARGELARGLIDAPESKGMLSAGYMEMRARTLADFSSAGVKAIEPERPYVRWTQAQCSTTVRDPKGTGSGWAGLSSYDWASIDGPALGERALQKCLASRNPVALEPGRYTVILEPQAVADLMQLFTIAFQRWVAEEGRGPFALAYDDALKIWRSKLGIKVVDERITISHDPADPALGIVLDPGLGTGPVTWIDRGVLTNLYHYRHTYALPKLNDHLGIRELTGYRMSGGDTSVDEMIATTKRGLLVTRFSNTRGLDPTSVLSTGLTRDGLWLVENGKISKAVKNFRFTESPLFVLNSIEQLGVPVPVFRPTRTGGELTPAIVPPLKVRDFSFTSAIDAI